MSDAPTGNLIFDGWGALIDGISTSIRASVDAFHTSPLMSHFLPDSPHSLLAKPEHLLSRTTPNNPLYILNTYLHH